MSALIGRLRSIGNRDLSGALNERAFNFDDVSMEQVITGECYQEESRMPVTQGVSHRTGGPVTDATEIMS